MPGTLIFRPIKGTFNVEKDKTMEPYCKFKMGWRSGKSSAAEEEQGNEVEWNDVVQLDRKHNEEYAKIHIKDNQRFFRRGIGKAKISLERVLSDGKQTEWFDIEHKGEVVGEVLLDIEYITY